MRMGMRRYTRLTNGFSKRIEQHTAAVAVRFMHYNFGRPHQMLTKAVGRQEEHTGDDRGNRDPPVVAHATSRTA
jgi:hypothetical protein